MLVGVSANAYVPACLQHNHGNQPMELSLHLPAQAPTAPRARLHDQWNRRCTNRHKRQPLYALADDQGNLRRVFDVLARTFDLHERSLHLPVQERLFDVLACTFDLHERSLHLPVQE